MADHLKGKTILITGGGSGFGRLVATKAAARGARIVVSDIVEDALAETVDLIEKKGGKALGIRADVTDRTEMRAFAAKAVEHFGAVDVLVNNAGVMPLAFFADHADADAAWDLCIDVNLKGVLHGISAVHDIMIEQGRGHVVNISSIYGNGPVPGAAVYGATKAAVRFMSEALRQESQGKIKVTTIRPTGVPTTALGGGIINPAAIGGVLGAGMGEFMEKMGEVFGENPPEHLTDPEKISYFALSAELLADQIIFTIDQPWGVSISDLTVRASGDSYML
jgi:NADP-dependent 3-hydroxy acid dehydrogenase YdfG